MSGLPVIIGIRELRDGLSRHLAMVKGGEEITVTDHGKPIARIVPIGSARGTLAELTAQGRIRPPAPGKRGQFAPPIKTNGTVSDLLIEMRG